MTIASDQTLIGRIDGYLRVAMLPLWAKHGWDEARGGHHERLQPDHDPVAVGFRRLTVCARQLFVYGRAARWGLMDGARATADRAFHYLVARFCDSKHGGFFFTVDLDGAPLDRGKDLYGHAFALLGLAEYFTVSRDYRVRDLLAQTDDTIVRRLLLAEGWYAAQAAADWSIDNKKLLQNPHMHLLEAYLAASKATGERRYQERVSELVALMRTRLVEPRSGTIIEYRDERGHADETRGHVIEPGHQFEWCWLLYQAAEIFDAVACRADAAKLYDWALAYGIDERFGGVYDQVSVDGTVIVDTKRIWPLTELIKANSARFTEARNPSQLAALRDSVQLLFTAYLLPDGGWHERLRRDLTSYDDTLPATTCYHILLGLLEARAALMSASDP